MPSICDLLLDFLRHTLLYHLVSETEVQALVPFICGGSQVVFLLFLSQNAPGIVTLLVHANVEELCANKDKDIVDTYANEDTVAATV